MAPADSIGIRTRPALVFCGNRPRTSERYFSVSGTTTKIARTSLLSSARLASAGVTSLNFTLARAKSYSLPSTLTSFRLVSPATTPMVARLSSASPSTEVPGGATKSATARATTITACAFDRSPTSPRTMARSVLPDENALADSTALEVSTMLRRTGAFFSANRPAIAVTIRPASPSSDPTAMLSVVGRAYQRYAKSPAPVTRITAPATRTIRSQPGNPNDVMRLSRRRQLRPDGFSLRWLRDFAAQPSADYQIR